MPRTYTNVEEVHVCIKVALKEELSSIPASSVSTGSDYEYQGCDAPRRSTEPIRMKSSMTFIRSNRRIERIIIWKENGGGTST